MREEIAKVRELLTNKDNADPEEIKKATNTLQQASLKLFELAYKKVRSNALSTAVQCHFLTIDILIRFHRWHPNANQMHHRHRRRPQLMRKRKNQRTRKRKKAKTKWSYSLLQFTNKSV